MATNVMLYIGTPPVFAKYRFTDEVVWLGVRTQIVTAMDAGHGLISVKHKDDTVVYVYSPFLQVSWTESGDRA